MAGRTARRRPVGTTPNKLQFSQGCCSVQLCTGGCLLGPWHQSVRVRGRHPDARSVTSHDRFRPKADVDNYLGLSCLRHVLLCGTYVRKGVRSEFSGVISAESSRASAKFSTNDNTSSCSNGPVISLGEMSSSNCSTTKKWQKISIGPSNKIDNPCEPSRFLKTLCDPGNGAATPSKVYENLYWLSSWSKRSQWKASVSRT